MCTKSYGFDEATVQITRTDGTKLAIFDVSRTTECRWICVGNKNWVLLTVFDDTRAMLKFVAKEQIYNATIPNEDGWLDDQAGIDGFDTWTEFVDNEQHSDEGAT